MIKREKHENDMAHLKQKIENDKDIDLDKIKKYFHNMFNQKHFLKTYGNVEFSDDEEGDEK